MEEGLAAFYLYTNAPQRSRPVARIIIELDILPVRLSMEHHVETVRNHARTTSHQAVLTRMGVQAATTRATYLRTPSNVLAAAMARAEVDPVGALAIWAGPVGGGKTCYAMR